MTEHDNDPEAARFEVAQYMQAGSGYIELPRLLTMRSACEGVRLTDPKENTAVAWMDMEIAMTKYNAGAANEEIALRLQAANERFMAIADNPAVNRLVREQANVAHHALPFYDIVLVDQPFDSAEIPTLFHSYTDAVHSAARVGLNQFERFKNQADVPYLHALAAIAAMQEDLLQHRCMGLPVSPRNYADPDEYNRWSVMLWAHENMWPMRIGPSRPQDLAGLSPDMFRNDEYPTKHGFGFLQAVLDDQKKGPLRQQKIVRPFNSKSPDPQMMLIESITITGNATKRDSREDFIHDVVTSVVGQLSEQVKRDLALKLAGEQHQVESVTLATWYKSLGPHDNPFEAGPELLESVISQLELTHAEEKLSAGGIESLAWAHLDFAENGPTDQATLSFDRAEDMLQAAADKYGEQGEMLGKYRTLLAKAGVDMRRAITIAKQVDTQAYCDTLAELGVALVEHYNTLQQQPDQAAHFAQLLHDLTYCLAVTMAPGGNVAAVSSPRQQAERGWNVTTWPVGDDDQYHIRHFVKVRLAQNPDITSRRDSVATIPYAHLGNSDTTFATLLAAIDTQQGVATWMSETQNQQQLWNMQRRVLPEITRMVAS